SVSVDFMPGIWPPTSVQSLSPGSASMKSTNFAAASCDLLPDQMPTDQPAMTAGECLPASTPGQSDMDTLSLPSFDCRVEIRTAEPWIIAMRSEANCSKRSSTVHVAACDGESPSLIIC